MDRTTGEVALHRRAGRSATQIHVLRPFCCSFTCTPFVRSIRCPLRFACCCGGHCLHCIQCVDAAATAAAAALAVPLAFRLHLRCCGGRKRRRMPAWPLTNRLMDTTTTTGGNALQRRRHRLHRSRWRRVRHAHALRRFTLEIVMIHGRCLTSTLHALGLVVVNETVASE